MEQSEAINGTALDMEPEGELLPEQDEVSRAAVVETAGKWTCPECKTHNNPNTFDEGASRENCLECGAEKPAGDEQDEPIMAAQGTTVGKPEDVPLPIEGDGDEGEGFERFNANKAMSTIIAKNIEVQASRDRYDSLKKQAAEAKKELDQDEAALGRIISQFARARETQNGPQALLPLNGQPAAIDSNCPWERNNPGFPCPVCSAAKKAKLDPDTGSAVHPEHDEHEDTATMAFAANVITPLIPKLKAKGLAITADELDELDADQLQALIDWTEQDGIVPPAILATSHVAAAPGTMAQLCKNCNIDLAHATDPEGFYDEGIRVGLDCDVKLEQVAKDEIDQVIPDEPPVEAARTPKSHAKKDGKKKREPEKERVEQVAAGKKKAEPKKAAKKGRK